jgi:hypothetical protein
MGVRIPLHHKPALRKRRALLWLYPRLGELPPESWDSALIRARDTEFDMAEWVGILGGVCLVAWLLGLATPSSEMAGRFLDHLLQFVLALPLLAVVVGPFYLRRTRRGLEREVSHKKRYASDAKSSFEGKES